ncbi:tripartite tricarboxylate transporter substrate-binding protein [Curvibacter sp. RS43]|uniref:Bug family tripartite tricarboxylate transporter substrate binding protein n=1 Tax=Curvibacter microcysteis TaxID=3026419 RepID=UPI002362FE15|nr:tripartite tricarboxylate transporter substrate-binding protein [Curvibacter sp. RS43]MDD0810030.1 tripartite tricarboxylate transporter substrate-binding protein [Curvibacter sp. RS43]
MSRWFLLFVVFALPISALAQIQRVYPDRPVRLVVPFQVGGAADQLARVLSECLSEAFRQTVWVDNKPGATGSIGTRQVARAAADGYTLLIGHSDSIVLQGLMHPNREKDVASGLMPIAFVGRIPGVLIARPELGIKSPKDLIQRAKQRPGQLKLASWGMGSTIHLGIEWMNQSANIELLHVPYAGTPAAVAAFYADQVDLVFVTADMALTAAQAGLAQIVGASSRDLALQTPGMPWLGDQGFEGLQLDTWYGVLAPVNTPAAIVAQLQREILKQLKNPQVTAKLKQAGFQLGPLGAADFSDLIRRERKFWQNLIAERRIPVLPD